MNAARVRMTPEWQKPPQRRPPTLRSARRGREGCEPPSHGAPGREGGHGAPTPAPPEAWRHTPGKRMHRQRQEWRKAHK
eukprot:8651665-Alexandrium_andersonii.AAC.1